MHTSISQKGLRVTVATEWDVGPLAGVLSSVSVGETSPHFSPKSKGKHSDPTLPCASHQVGPCVGEGVGVSLGSKERKAPNWGVGGSGCRIPRVSGLALGTPKQAGHWVLERYPYSVLIL